MLLTLVASRLPWGAAVKQVERNAEHTLTTADQAMEHHRMVMARARSVEARLRLFGH